MPLTTRAERDRTPPKKLPYERLSSTGVERPVYRVMLHRPKDHATPPCNNAPKTKDWERGGEGKAFGEV